MLVRRRLPNYSVSDDNPTYTVYQDQDIDRMNRSFFESGKLFSKSIPILLPSNNGSSNKWVDLNTCRWLGPEWLETKHRLGAYFKYQPLSHLFTMVLKIKDADHKDWLDELEHMKNCKLHDVPKAKEIYRCLQREFEMDATYEFIR